MFFAAKNVLLNSYFIHDRKQHWSLSGSICRMWSVSHRDFFHRRFSSKKTNMWGLKIIKRVKQKIILKIAVHLKIIPLYMCVSSCNTVLISLLLSLYWNMLIFSMKFIYIISQIALQIAVINCNYCESSIT